MPGADRVRLLEAGAGPFVVVANDPLKRYGEAALRRGLTNIEWVSRAAVAHEKVVESFVAERAVLPMKLFTIFKSDVRTVEYVGGERARIALRPSGTEPKAKAYVEVCAPPCKPGAGEAEWLRTRQEVDDLAKRLADDFLDKALSLVGLKK